jgi:4-amino-4-deoxy-L-arabinose transferase-like glycosyltransferase
LEGLDVNSKDKGAEPEIADATSYNDIENRRTVIRTLRLRQFGLIAGILVIAAVLRLARLDLMEFKSDEAKVTMMVVDGLKGGGLPTRGLMSSVGIPNPPFFIYLMMIPGLVSFDPIFLARFIALLNVAAVFFCYWFGRRIFNDRVGLVSALFFAVSPWAVIYSRKIWAQDCLPLFSLLVIGGLFELCVNKDRRWFLPTALAAAMMPGIHFSGIFPLLIFACAIAVFRPRAGWRRWCVVAAASCAAYLPFALRHFTRGAMGRGASAHGVTLDPLAWAAQIMTCFNFKYLLGVSEQRFFDSIAPKVLWLCYALGGSLVILFVVGTLGVTVDVVNGIRRSDDRREGIRRVAGRAICVIWALVPVLGYLALSFDKPIFPHYLIVLYPAQFWLAAAALDRILQRPRSLWRVSAAGFTVLVALFHTLFLSGFLGFVDREGGTRGDYGVAYKHKSAAAGYVIDTCSERETRPVLTSAFGAVPFEIIYLIISSQKYASSPKQAGGRRETLFFFEEQWPPIDDFASWKGGARKKVFGPLIVTVGED